MKTGSTALTNEKIKEWFADIRKGDLYCPFDKCTWTFFTSFELAVHLKEDCTIGRYEGCVPCTHCNEFLKADDLRTHWRRMHKDKIEVKERGEEEMKVLLEDWQSNINEGIFGCGNAECEETFILPESMFNHMKSCRVDTVNEYILGVDEIECLWCKKETKLSNFEEHAQNKHTMIMEVLQCESKIYMCQNYNCNVLSDTGQEYLQHTVECPTCIVCVDCKLTFTSEEEYGIHDCLANDELFCKRSLDMWRNQVQSGHMRCPNPSCLSQFYMVDSFVNHLKKCAKKSRFCQKALAEDQIPCSHCHVMLSVDDYASHVLSEHSEIMDILEQMKEGKKMKCLNYKCKKMFDNGVKYLHHLTLCKPLYLCSICAKEFHGHNAYDGHRCLRGDKESITVDNEWYTNIKAAIYNCPNVNCNRSFQTFEGLIPHLTLCKKGQASELILSKDIFGCCICKEDISLASFLDHFKEKHNQVMVQLQKIANKSSSYCVLCRKPFVDRHLFLQHTMQCSRKASKKCVQDEFTLSTWLGEIKKGILSCPNKCSIVFNDVEKFISHITECACDTNAEKAVLTPLPCLICKNDFDVYDLIDHFKSSHTVVFAQLRLVAQGVCIHCPNNNCKEAFSEGFRYLKHVATVCQLNILCESCDSYFQSQELLTNHHCSSKDKCSQIPWYDKIRKGNLCCPNSTCEIEFVLPRNFMAHIRICDEGEECSLVLKRKKLPCCFCKLNVPIGKYVAHLASCHTKQGIKDGGTSSSFIAMDDEDVCGQPGDIESHPYIQSNKRLNHHKVPPIKPSKSHTSCDERSKLSDVSSPYTGESLQEGILLKEYDNTCPIADLDVQGRTATTSTINKSSEEVITDSSTDVTNQGKVRNLKEPSTDDRKSTCMHTDHEKSSIPKSDQLNSSELEHFGKSSLIDTIALSIQSETQSMSCVTKSSNTFLELSNKKDQKCLSENKNIAPDRLNNSEISLSSNIGLSRSYLANSQPYLSVGYPPPSDTISTNVYPDSANRDRQFYKASKIITDEKQIADIVKKVMKKRKRKTKQLYKSQPLLSWTVIPMPKPVKIEFDTKKKEGFADDVNLNESHNNEIISKENTDAMSKLDLSDGMTTLVTNSMVNQIAEKGIDSPAGSTESPISEMNKNKYSLSNANYVDNVWNRNKSINHRGNVDNSYLNLAPTKKVGTVGENKDPMTYEPISIVPEDNFKEDPSVPIGISSTLASYGIEESTNDNTAIDGYKNKLKKNTESSINEDIYDNSSINDGSVVKFSSLEVSESEEERKEAFLRNLELTSAKSSEINVSMMAQQPAKNMRYILRQPCERKLPERLKDDIEAMFLMKRGKIKKHAFGGLSSLSSIEDTTVFGKINNQSSDVIVHASQGNIDEFKGGKYIATCTGSSHGASDVGNLEIVDKSSALTTKKLPEFPLNERRKITVDEKYFLEDINGSDASKERENKINKQGTTSAEVIELASALHPNERELIAMNINKDQPSVIRESSCESLSNEADENLRGVVKVSAVGEASQNDLPNEKSISLKGTLSENKVISVYDNEYTTTLDVLHQKEHENDYENGAEFSILDDSIKAESASSSIVEAVEKMCDRNLNLFDHLMSERMSDSELDFDEHDTATVLTEKKDVKFGKSCAASEYDTLSIEKGKTVKEDDLLSSAFEEDVTHEVDKNTVSENLLFDVEDTLSSDSEMSYDIPLLSEDRKLQEIKHLPTEKKNIAVHPEDTKDKGGKVSDFNNLVTVSGKVFNDEDSSQFSQLLSENESAKNYIQPRPTSKGSESSVEVPLIDQENEGLSKVNDWLHENKADPIVFTAQLADSDAKNHPAIEKGDIRLGQDLKANKLKRKLPEPSDICLPQKDSDSSVTDDVKSNKISKVSISRRFKYGKSPFQKNDKVKEGKQRISRSITPRIKAKISDGNESHKLSVELPNSNIIESDVNEQCKHVDSSNYTVESEAAISEIAIRGSNGSEISGGVTDIDVGISSDNKVMKQDKDESWMQMEEINRKSKRLVASNSKIESDVSSKKNTCLSKYHDSNKIETTEQRAVINPSLSSDNQVVKSGTNETGVQVNQVVLDDNEILYSDKLEDVNAGISFENEIHKSNLVKTCGPPEVSNKENQHIPMGNSHVDKCNVNEVMYSDNITDDDVITGDVESFSDNEGDSGEVYQYMDEPHDMRSTEDELEKSYSKLDAGILSVIETGDRNKDEFSSKLGGHILPHILSDGSYDEKSIKGLDEVALFLMAYNNKNSEISMTESYSNDAAKSLLESSVDSSNLYLESNSGFLYPMNNNNHKEKQKNADVNFIDFKIEPGDYNREHNDSEFHEDDTETSTSCDNVVYGNDSETFTSLESQTSGNGIETTASFGVGASGKMLDKDILNSTEAKLLGIGSPTYQLESSGFADEFASPLKEMLFLVPNNKYDIADAVAESDAGTPLQLSELPHVQQVDIHQSGQKSGLMASLIKQNEMSSLEETLVIENELQDLLSGIPEKPVKQINASQTTWMKKLCSFDFYCVFTECKRVFWDPYSLIDHMQNCNFNKDNSDINWSVLSGTSVECPMCKRLLKICSYGSHYKQDHYALLGMLKELGRKGVVKCCGYQCPTVLTSVPKCVNHSQTCQAVKHYRRCGKCGKGFRREKSYHAHICKDLRRPGGDGGVRRRRRKKSNTSQPQPVLRQFEVSLENMQLESHDFGKSKHAVKSDRRNSPVKYDKKVPKSIPSPRKRNHFLQKVCQQVLAQSADSSLAKKISHETPDIPASGDLHPKDENLPDGLDRHSTDIQHPGEVAEGESETQKENISGAKSSSRERKRSHTRSVDKEDTSSQAVSSICEYQQQNSTSVISPSVSPRRKKGKQSTTVTSSSDAEIDKNLSLFEDSIVSSDKSVNFQMASTPKVQTQFNESSNIDGNQFAIKERRGKNPKAKSNDDFIDKVTAETLFNLRENSFSKQSMDTLSTNDVFSIENASPSKKGRRRKNRGSEKGKECDDSVTSSEPVTSCNRKTNEVREDYTVTTEDRHSRAYKEQSNKNKKVIKTEDDGEFAERDKVSNTLPTEVESNTLDVSLNTDGNDSDGEDLSHVKVWLKYLAKYNLYCPNKHCFKQFYRFNTLMNHMRACVRKCAPYQNARMKCPECDFKAPTIRKLHLHFSSRHLLLDWYLRELEAGFWAICQNYKCAKYMEDIEVCVEHYRKCDYLWKCKYCQIEFSKEEKVKLHHCQTSSEDENDDGGNSRRDDENKENKKRRGRPSGGGKGKSNFSMIKNEIEKQFFGKGSNDTKNNNAKTLNKENQKDSSGDKNLLPINCKGRKVLQPSNEKASIYKPPENNQHHSIGIISESDKVATNNEENECKQVRDNHSLHEPSDSNCFCENKSKFKSTNSTKLASSATADLLLIEKLEKSRYSSTEKSDKRYEFRNKINNCYHPKEPAVKGKENLMGDFEVIITKLYSGLGEDALIRWKENLEKFHFDCPFPTCSYTCSSPSIFLRHVKCCNLSGDKVKRFTIKNQIQTLEFICPFSFCKGHTKDYSWQDYLNHLKLCHTMVFSYATEIGNNGKATCLNYTCGEDITNMEEAVSHYSVCKYLWQCELCHQEYRCGISMRNHMCSKKRRNSRKKAGKGLLVKFGNADRKLLKRKSAVRAIDILSNISDDSREKRQKEVDNDDIDNQLAESFDDNDSDYSVSSSGSESSETESDEEMETTSDEISTDADDGKKIKMYNEKFFKEWRETNIPNELCFPQFMPVKSNITFLDESTSKDFLPSSNVLEFEVEYYCSVRIKKKSRANVDSLTAMPPLKGSASLGFNSGAPIWGLDWCPLPSDEDQHIAISTHRAFGETHCAADVTATSGCIQIWNLGKLASKETSEKCPYFAFGLCHNFGPVYDIKWYPYGYSKIKSDEDDKSCRLGLLAVACGDGKVRIFSIPNPKEISSEEPIFVDMEANITLIPHKNNSFERHRTGICLCLSWLMFGNFRRIAAGYGDGGIRIWDVETKSILLLVEDIKSRAVLPIITIDAHSHAVRSLSWCPYRTDILASASSDRTLKVFDIKQPNNPLFVIKRGSYTDIEWSIARLNLFFTEDDAFNIWPSSARCLTFEKIFDKGPHATTRHNAVVWSCAYNNYLDLLATCDAAGEVIVSRDQDTVCSKRATFRRKIVPVYQLQRCIINDNEKADCSENRIMVDLECINVVDDYKSRADAIHEVFHEFDYKFKDYNKFEFSKSVNTKDIDIMRYCKTENLQSSSVETYETRSVHKVCWNPNYGCHTWLASGTRLGIVRLHNFKAWT